MLPELFLLLMLIKNLRAFKALKDKEIRKLLTGGFLL